MRFFVPKGAYMNQIRRALLFVLIFLFVLSGAPVQAMAATLPVTSPKATVTTQLSNSLVELTELRTETSRTFQKPDGSKQLEVYSEAVNYPVENNGKTTWQAIDNNLKLTSNGYQNAAGPVSITLPTEYKKSGTVISKGNYKVEILPAELRPLTLNSAILPSLFKAEVVSNKITYREVNTGVNKVYFATPKGLKEQIVINNAAAATGLSYKLRLSNLNITAQPDGSYILVDSTTGKQVFVIPAMFMWDSAGGKDSPNNQYSSDIKTTIAKSGANYVISVIPSSSWLKDAKRVYPVIIDPTIEVGRGGNEDSYLEQRYPTTRTWDQRYLYVGNDRTSSYPKYITRTIIPFEIPDLTDARISNATFSVRQNNCNDSCPVTGVTANLTAGYNDWDVYWNNQPNMMGEVGYAYGMNSNPMYYMDVTTAARYWYEGHNPNGSRVGSLEFKLDAEDWHAYRIWIAENNPDFGSSEKPKLTINYNDYNSYLDIQGLPTDYVDINRSDLRANVFNIGHGSWGGDTNLSYHIYRSDGTLVVYDGIRTDLPRYPGPHGDHVYISNINFQYPSSPGDYIVKWDLVQEGVTWFSDQGIPTTNMNIHVDDYPECAAQYNITSPPPAKVTSGGTISVPVALQNDGRYDWTSDKYALTYHIYEKATGAIYYFDGPWQDFPTVISRRGGTGKMILQVRAPLNAGDYVVKIDVVWKGIDWFINRGVTTANFNVTVENPSFSVINHLGVEKYYTMSGPVDLSTGNLTYSSTDMTVPSNTGLLSFTRSYNSAALDTLYNQDSNGYIHNWLLNGPYRESNQNTRLDKAFVANEAGVRPTAGLVSSNNLWFETNSNSGILNINEALHDAGSVEHHYTNDMAVYAHSYVYSPTTRSVKLKLGSDDGMKVWLNGSVIATVYDNRGITPDSEVYNVTLNAGWNSLLMKVANTTGGYALSARFTDLTDLPFTDLKYANSNQEIFGISASMGKGWMTSLDERLVTSDENNIFYRDSTGAVDIFVKKLDGSYQRPAGLAIDLVKNGDIGYTIVSKSGLKTSFSPSGLLQNRIDLSGNIVEYVSDESGKITGIKDGNRNINISYDTAGRVNVVKNELNNLIKYQYDDTVVPSRLSAVVDGLGNSYKYEYSSSGKLLKFIDKKGNQTLVSYDMSNRVSGITDAQNNSTKIEYRNNENKTRDVTITDALGRKTYATFDAINLLINSTNAKNYREIYQNDSNYNVATVIPDVPENDYYFYRYSNTYDSNDNLLTSVDPMNRTTTNEYIDNVLINTTAADGKIYTYNYSKDGRRLLLSTKNPTGEELTYTYDSRGHIASTTSPKGETIRTEYTIDGDAAYVVSAKQEKTEYGYNNIGQKISDKSPLGAITKYEYNSVGQLARVIDPSGLTVSYEYDANGNNIKEINPKGVAKQYEYDSLSRLVKVIDEAGAVTETKYDIVGNKIKEIGASGKATVYEYDELNQLTKQTDVSGKASLVEYDRNGNVAKVTDQNGGVTTQETNKNGETTKVTDPLGVTNITYDSFGKVKNTSSTANAEQTSVEYDANNNVAKVISSLTGEQTVTYDQNNNPITSTSPSAQVSASYDANGRVNQLKFNLKGVDQPITSGFNYDAEGKLVSVANANGNSMSLAYDKSGRVSLITDKYGAQTEKFAYKYDKGSNIIEAVNIGRGASGSILPIMYTKTSTYEYDVRDQLIRENNTAYTYDLLGNRLTRTDGKLQTQYIYDESGDPNRLVKTVLPSNVGTVNYEYDANGNTVLKKYTPTSVVGIGEDGNPINKAQLTHYYYDNDNYFSKAVLPDGSMVEYTYDKLSKHRVMRTETSASGVKTITKFVYNGDLLVSENDENDEVLRSYTWDGQENLISMFTKDSQGKMQEYFYLKNGHSDIIGLADSSGKKVISYNYDAWGNLVNAAGVQENIDLNNYALNPRMFSGYWYDVKLGLYYMKARMYSPEIGRFLSQDPVKLSASTLDQNPYIYCANNPVNRIDPSGKGSFWSNAWNKVKQVVAKAAAVVATYNPITLIGNKLGEVLYNKGYGDACQYLYDHNKVARFAMDHPFIAGAAVGVAAAGIAVGASAIITVVANFAYTQAVSAISSIGVALQSIGSKMSQVATNRINGNAFEKFSQSVYGFVKNYKPITTITGSRIPDGLDKVLTECKNVNYLSNNPQLRGFVDYTTTNGMDMNLYVAARTQISGPLQKVIDAGYINLIRTSFK